MRFFFFFLSTFSSSIFVFPLSLLLPRRRTELSLPSPPLLYYSTLPPPPLLLFLLQKYECSIFFRGEGAGKRTERETSFLCYKKKKKKKKTFLHFLHFLFSFSPSLLLLGLSPSLSLSLRLSFETTRAPTKTTMSSSEDPYALHADGTAVDPRAFREAALADAALAEDLKGDARASRVLASGDDAALQELLKEVHQVRRRLSLLLLLVVLFGGRGGGGWDNGRRNGKGEKEGKGGEGRK